MSEHPHVHIKEGEKNTKRIAEKKNQKPTYTYNKTQPRKNSEIYPSHLPPLPKQVVGE